MKFIIKIQCVKERNENLTQKGGESYSNKER